MTGGREFQVRDDNVRNDACRESMLPARAVADLLAYESLREVARSPTRENAGWGKYAHYYLRLIACPIATRRYQTAAHQLCSHYARPASRRARGGLPR